MNDGEIYDENYVSSSDSGEESDSRNLDSNESRDDPTYNTINSLDALKEIISQNANGLDNLWFKHYFLRHVNRLPSRNQYQVRRLSQCREEDEGNEHESPPKDSSSLTESPMPSQTPTDSPSRRESKKPLSLVELFQNPPSDITSPSCKRATSPRVDRHFFDSSLVEMKSQVSSSTIEYDSGEELWVKRTPDNTSCNGSKLVSYLVSASPIILTLF